MIATVGWTRSDVVMAAGASSGLIATTSTFGPWGASGARVRTSYEVVQIAEQAGVLAPRLAPLTVVWFLVPMLCGLLLVAVASRRRRWSGLAAITLGALVTAGGVLVARSPLVTEPGAIIGALAGGCTMLAGVVVLVTARNDEAGS